MELEKKWSYLQLYLCFMLMRYDYGMRSKFNKDLGLWCTFGTGRMRIAAAVLIDR